MKSRSDLFKKRDSATAEEASRPAILIIDDDVTVRESLHLVLKDHYNVLLCASAQEGLAALHDELCLVVLDVKLKGHDGFWACDEIRKLQPHIPIVFYSAYQDLKDPYDVINQHRPFGYIMKGGEMESLLNRIEMAARVGRLIVENRKLLAQLQKRRLPRQE
jgi:DNA-binding NtrC family response regulator